MGTISIRLLGRVSPVRLRVHSALLLRFVRFVMLIGILPRIRGVKGCRRIVRKSIVLGCVLSVHMGIWSSLGTAIHARIRYTTYFLEIIQLNSCEKFCPSFYLQQASSFGERMGYSLVVAVVTIFAVLLV